MLRRTLSLALLSIALASPAGALADGHAQPVPGPLSPAPPAHGESDDNAGDARTVGDHRFEPPIGIPMPLATSHFSMISGGGLARLNAAEVDNMGNPTGVLTTYDLALVAIGIEGQRRIYDSFTVRAGLVGLAQVGVNGTAALNAGGTLAYTLLLGASWIKPLGDSWQLGLGVEFAGGRSFNLNILSAIVNSVTAGEISADSLFVSADTGSARFGVQLAKGFSPTLGTFSFVTVSANSTKLEGETTVEVTTQEVEIGAGLSYKPTDWLALTPAFIVEVPSSDTNQKPLYELAISAGYVARPELFIGIDTRISGRSIEGGGGVSLIQGLLRMRYDF